MEDQNSNKQNMNEKILVVTVKSQKKSGEKIFRLHKRRAVLGSSTSSDICLDDASISPVHAILEVSGVDGKPVVYDLASDTGIMINGSQSVQSTLGPDDQLQIGPYLLQTRIQFFNEIPVAPKAAAKESFGQHLFINEKEDLKPLLLEDEALVDAEGIFDYSASETKQSLQVVMFYNQSILDVEHFVDKKRIVIGPSSKEDFGVPPFFGALKGKNARFELVTNDGGQYYLHLHESMQGVLHHDDQMHSFQDVLKTKGASRALPLKEKDFAKVKLNDVQFFLSFTQAPPTLKRRRIFDRDPVFLKVWTLSLVLTGLLFFSMANIAVNPTIEIEQLPERIATIIYEPKPVTTPAPVVIKQPEKQPEKEPEKVAVKKPEPPKVIKLNPDTKVTTKAPKDAEISDQKQKITKLPAETKKQQALKNKPATFAGGQEGAGVRAKGEEGSRGAPDKKAAKDHQLKAQRPGVGPKTNNAATNRGASETNDLGLVDMFKSNKGTLDKVFAGGKGVSNAANKLEGYSGFTSQGEGGLGAAGSGKGGGGTSEGLGGLSDHGVGGGKKGTGLGALGSGGNILGGRGKLNVDSGGGSGEPIVMGAIDMDAIARAIEAHRDEIRACYESEISAGKPDLSGRVGVRFVIGPSGIVNSAGVSSSSIRNANVENCVVSVIKRIEFPKVKGGGIAEVTYPFVFKPSHK